MAGDSGIACCGCGYDVRAQPAEGKCPECETPVAESVEMAKIPVRPAWGESDPRWRRRMLAGVWLLVFLPLMTVLNELKLLDKVPAPNVFPMRATVNNLGETFLGGFGVRGVYEPVVFCMGMALLFSRERGRQRRPLDWTRRWGVLGSYVVLLLSAAGVLFITSLVGVGIGALFQSMPPRYQPRLTHLLVSASTAYLAHGPQPKESADLVSAAFSAGAMMLACGGLLEAMRSCGPRRAAMYVLAPLALCAAWNLGEVGRAHLTVAGVKQSEMQRRAIYFCPESVVVAAAKTQLAGAPQASGAEVFAEGVKWCAMLAVAVWLTVAQVAAWRESRRRRRGARSDSA